MRLLIRLLAGVLVATSLVAVPTPAPAAPQERCHGVPVVVLPDIAGRAADGRAIARALRRDGRCVHVLAWGAPRALAGTPLAPLVGLGGLESIEEATTEIGDDLARLGGAR